MGRGGDGKTDRFRTVFEPEDIFDRFVKNANANASTEASLPDEDEVTGCTPMDRVQADRELANRGQADDAQADRLRRGGPPSWDHRITVVAPEPAKPDESEAPIADGPDPEDIASGDAGSGDTDSGDTSSGDTSSGDTDSRDTTVGLVPSLEARPPEPARLASDSFDSAELSSVDAMTVPRASPLLTDSGQRVLLLTQVKPASKLEPLTPDEPQPVEVVFPESEEPASDENSASTWQSVVAPRGQHTQRIEAAKLVPDVAASRRPDVPLPSETGEDGQMPSRELDQILGDMAVLLRYGHAAQVCERLEQLRRAYPEDLLLLRRIAEFHVETDQVEAALDALFALARGLFERRNVEGMRQALQQVRVLDADNKRAARLLGLLDARADGTDA